jgi:membrane dipeptidase
VNDLGDIQTEDPVHGGLTSVGKEVVTEMNRLGIVVDLAHATQNTTAHAAAQSTTPIVISHSHLASEGAPHPRLLAPDHARLVADTGGVVGAWPAGIVSATLDDYVEEICRLVDLIGIQHVAIGTDMDANYRPVLDRYDQMGTLGQLLQARGLTASDVDAVMGGNYLRVWSTVEQAAI